LKQELPPQPNYISLLSILYNQPIANWSKVFKKIRLIAKRDKKHQPEGGFILTSSYSMQNKERSNIRIYKNQKLILPARDGFIEVPFPGDFNETSFITLNKLNGGGFGADCLRIEIYVCDSHNEIVSKRSIGFDSQDIWEANVKFYKDRFSTKQCLR
jgi:hypothetical protein